MKRLMMLVALLGSCAATAMPTKEELQKAQPLLEELMSEDMSALKKKAKTPAQVGEDALKFAVEAETEAAKFLLYKGALIFFVRGGEYEKAADVVATLKEGVSDVPPDVVAEIIATAARGVTAKKAPRLMALYRAAQAQARALKSVEAAKAALAKRPDDAKIRRVLAESLALAGNWGDALAEFAKLGGVAGKAAKDELAGVSPAEVADFWWEYASGQKDEANAFQAHAAVLYKVALEEGVVTGLRKPVVEKRVKQVEERGVPVTSEPDQRKPVELKLSEQETLRFLPCPAGRALIRPSGGNYPLKRRNVTITRPFWMTESLVTMGQYAALTPGWDRFPARFNFSKKDIQKIVGHFGGDRTAASHFRDAEIDAFCMKVRDRLGSSIPAGYVVRLPSDAEWAYVFGCGGKTKIADYANLNAGRAAVHFDEIGVDLGFYSLAAIKDLGVVKHSHKDGWMLGANLPRYQVMTRKPNDWGFYDMAGLSWEKLLDTVALPANFSGWEPGVQSFFQQQYNKLAEGSPKDPLLLAEGDVGRHIQVLIQPNGHWSSWVLRDETGHDICFRLVIGPDLAAEKIAQAAK